MTERSRVWDGTSLGDATSAPYDAATKFAEVLGTAGGGVSHVNMGAVLGGYLESLAPSISGSNVIVGRGNAIVAGTYYSNDTSITTAISTPASSTRLDYFVIRKSWAAQTARLTRIVGVEGGGAPAIVQVYGTTWDLPLFVVSMTTGGVLTVSSDVRVFMGQMASHSWLIARDHIVVTGSYSEPNKPASTNYSGIRLQYTPGSNLGYIEAASSAGVVNPVHIHKVTREYVQVSGAYEMVQYDDIVECLGTAPYTIKLPNSATYLPVSGSQAKIINATNGAITVDGNGHNIGNIGAGTSTVTIAQGDTLDFIYSGPSTIWRQV